MIAGSTDNNAQLGGRPAPPGPPPPDGGRSTERSIAGTDRRVGPQNSSEQPRSLTGVVARDVEQRVLDLLLDALVSQGLVGAGG
jgi:hypothetical protein